ncbi:hypothetical protein AB0K89_02385 [Streptomyces cinnamoneus]|uniref:hypothetical protein n=1 Tax=Streptomyces cinnamoneus TaxID=53446 RepID=UPI0034262A9B
MPEPLEFRRSHGVDEVRQTILDLRVEVRGNFSGCSRGRSIRSSGSTSGCSPTPSAPGWETGVAHSPSGELVGLCFGTPLGPDTR